MVYLDDVNRLDRVFLKEQHGGSVCVYVVLLQEPGAACATLVHKAETHIISEGKCRQLRGRMERLEPERVLKTRMTLLLYSFLIVNHLR